VAVPVDQRELVLEILPVHSVLIEVKLQVKEVAVVDL
jgi:hypothetical protein